MGFSISQPDFLSRPAEADLILERELFCTVTSFCGSGLVKVLGLPEGFFNRGLEPGIKNT